MSIAVTTTDPTNTGVSTTSSSSLTGSNAADLQSSFLTKTRTRPIQWKTTS